MAEGKILSNHGYVVVEEKTIISGASATTPYYEQQVNVAKTGYTLIGVGASLSSTGLRFYKLRPKPGNIAEVGFATYNNSGTINNINVYATLTYARNDLL